ncbi:MAG TPA: hypothetical protein VEB67_02215 [Nitrososphaerales archaeon]|nr:hypothetical protein [Nitrososphaerales archaeon]
MSDDDAAYKKSVRNMSIVLAAIVITVFAAIFIPPYLNPAHDEFQKSVSLGTGQGFTLYLDINSTALSPSNSLNVTAWEVSTAPAISNVTALSNWSVPVSDLYTSNCFHGWPIGIGLMQGHYDQDNYSLGSMIPLTYVAAGCAQSQGTSSPPQWFAFEPDTSDVIASQGGTLVHWTLLSQFTFNHSSSSIFDGNGVLAPGVYTVVAADEWGDVLTTNFTVSA